MLAANCNGHGPKNRLVHRCMPNYIMLTKDTVRAIYYLCNLWLLSIMPNQCDAGIFQTVLRDSIYRGWEASTQQGQRQTIFFVLCQRETLYIQSYSESMPNRWYKNFLEPKLQNSTSNRLQSLVFGLLLLFFEFKISKLHNS